MPQRSRIILPGVPVHLIRRGMILPTFHRHCAKQVASMKQSGIEVNRSHIPSITFHFIEATLLDLWRSATVQIPELESVMTALPDLLASLDPNDFAAAAEVLWQRYGLDGFVYDISRLSPNSFL